MLKDFTLSIPFSEHVSYLCVSEEKNKQIIENFRQLIVQRFTDKLAIFKINFVWKFDYVRFKKWRTSVIKFTFKVYSSYDFFWMINILLIELFVWPQTIEA